MITDDILKILGYSGQCTLEEVATAIQTVRIADTQEWKQKNTIASKLALLKRKRKVAA